MEDIVRISKVKDKVNIPPELKNIQDVYEFTITGFCDSIVYFLCMDDTIVYIGKTERPLCRLQDHISEQRKIFNRIFFITVPLSELGEYEHALIEYFNPPYNGCGYHSSPETKKVKRYRRKESYNSIINKLGLSQKPNVFLEYFERSGRVINFHNENNRA